MLYIGVGGSAKISVHGAGCSRNQRPQQRNLCWRGGDVLDRHSAAFLGLSSPHPGGRTVTFSSQPAQW